MKAACFGTVFVITDAMVTIYEANARIFKAFCDENRLRILELLQSGEKCACKLLEDLNITQSTLSHHMKILCDSGIVCGRREGKWTHYSLAAEGCAHASEVLTQILTMKHSGESGCCN